MAPLERTDTKSAAHQSQSSATLQGLRQRLSLEMDPRAFDPDFLPRKGDHVLNPRDSARVAAMQARRAAVLVPLIVRPEGLTILLTRRSTHLRDHSGQIAFPGGKIDATDASPLAAALREADEEIGLASHHVRPIGLLDPYQTGTGFRIIPVVAEVSTPFDLTLNTQEVEVAFEVPLAFLADPANLQLRSGQWQGVTRHFYAWVWQDHVIWGATAGIIHNFHERLTG